MECFGAESTLLPKSSFNDAFAAVQSQEADYASIPLENSTNGSVVQTLDLLADREGRYGDLAVCGEYYLSIHHCLLVKSGSESGSGGGASKSPGTYIHDPQTSLYRSSDTILVDTKVENPPDEKYASIEKLYSHPQVWGQCENFLSKHFKGVEKQDVSSTSKAAEIVSQEPDDAHSAAIASKFAGDMHGLEAMAENIEDTATNTTRFIILRNIKSETSKGLHPSVTQRCGQPNDKQKRKTLISFMIDHNSPGALADALVIFKRHGMNLTSINSRPGGVQVWQYIFFVECQMVSGAHDEKVVEKVMKDLLDVTEKCRDLGSWCDQLNSK